MIQQLEGERTELEIAVTNALSSPIHGLPVGPVLLSTTPVPLRSKRARQSDIPSGHRIGGRLPSAARQAAFRFGFVALCVALRLRSTSRFPTADRSGEQIDKWSILSFRKILPRHRRHLLKRELHAGFQMLAGRKDLLAMPMKPSHRRQLAQYRHCLDSLFVRQHGASKCAEHNPSCCRKSRRTRCK